MTLLSNNVQGGFPPEVFDELSRNNGLAREIVQDLLDAHFPETMHRDILDAVGIEFSMETRVVIARDPEFRERVLRAYEYSCAVCGFDVRLGNILIAVEAATLSGIKPAVRTRSATASPCARSTTSFSIAACLQFPTPCQSLSPKALMARGDFRNGSLHITERRFDHRNAPTITLMKIGSPGTCERYSKVLVGISYFAIAILEMVSMVDGGVAFFALVGSLTKQLAPFWIAPGLGSPVVYQLWFCSTRGFDRPRKFTKIPT